MLGKVVLPAGNCGDCHHELGSFPFYILSKKSECIKKILLDIKIIFSDGIYSSFSSQVQEVPGCV